MHSVRGNVDRHHIDNRRDVNSRRPIRRGGGIRARDGRILRHADAVQIHRFEADQTARTVAVDFTSTALILLAAGNEKGEWQGESEGQRGASH